MYEGALVFYGRRPSCCSMVETVEPVAVEEQMKVTELEGALLAEWVARANGWPVEIEDVDEPNSPLYCRDDRGIPTFDEHTSTAWTARVRCS